MIDFVLDRDARLDCECEVETVEYKENGNEVHSFCRDPAVIRLDDGGGPEYLCIAHGKSRLQTLAMSERAYKAHPSPVE